ncbi:uncharacterized protein LOC134534634 [Bacillus rossius redtenbacheri]|uniref:uncharacterized protein LOC134534634 n=1 Tax=Bacillus rossius redtenbacheri TaxID=93214 RepID=UPI002FDE68A1
MATHVDQLPSRARVQSSAQPGSVCAAVDTASPRERHWPGRQRDAPVLSCARRLACGPAAQQSEGAEQRAARQCLRRGRHGLAQGAALAGPPAARRPCAVLCQETSMWTSCPAERGARVQSSAQPGSVCAAVDTASPRERHWPGRQRDAPVLSCARRLACGPAAQQSEGAEQRAARQCLRRGRHGLAQGAALAGPPALPSRARVQSSAQPGSVCAAVDTASPRQRHWPGRQRDAPVLSCARRLACGPAAQQSEGAEQRAAGQCLRRGRHGLAQLPSRARAQSSAQPGSVCAAVDTASPRERHWPGRQRDAPVLSCARRLACGPAAQQSEGAEQRAAGQARAQSSAQPGSVCAAVDTASPRQRHWPGRQRDAPVLSCARRLACGPAAQQSEGAEQRAARQCLRRGRHGLAQGAALAGPPARRPCAVLCQETSMWTSCPAERGRRAARSQAVSAPRARAQSSAQPGSVCAAVDTASPRERHWPGRQRDAPVLSCARRLACGPAAQQSEGAEQRAARQCLRRGRHGLAQAAALAGPPARRPCAVLCQETSMWTSCPAERGCRAARSQAVARAQSSAQPGSVCAAVDTASPRERHWPGSQRRDAPVLSCARRLACGPAAQQSEGAEQRAAGQCLRRGRHGLSQGAALAGQPAARRACAVLRQETSMWTSCPAERGARVQSSAQPGSVCAAVDTASPRERHWPARQRDAPVLSCARRLACGPAAQQSEGAEQRAARQCLRRGRHGLAQGAALAGPPARRACAVLCQETSMWTSCPAERGCRAARSQAVSAPRARVQSSAQPGSVCAAVDTASPRERHWPGRQRDAPVLSCARRLACGPAAQQSEGAEQRAARQCLRRGRHGLAQGAALAGPPAARRACAVLCQETSMWTSCPAERGRRAARSQAVSAPR